jgi:signal transduction histidine kinase
MTAALYALCAAVALALAARAIARTALGARTLARLGVALATAWLALALSFLPGADDLRLVWMTGVLLAADGVEPALRQLDVVRATQPPRRRRAWILTLAGLASAAHLMGWRGQATASPPEIAAGLLSLAMLARALWSVHEESRVRPLLVERRRLALIRGLLGAGMVTGTLEAALRYEGATRLPGAIAFHERGLTLQGVLPPLSPFIATAFLFTLWHGLEARRLVVLQELLAASVATAIAATALVGVEGVVFAAVDLPRFPLHGLLLLLLASGVVLGLHATYRHRLLAWTNNWFRAPGDGLIEAVAHARRRVADAEDEDRTAEAVVDALRASGRVRSVAIYVEVPSGARWRRASAWIAPGDDAPLDLSPATDAGSQWRLRADLGADDFRPLGAPSAGAIVLWHVDGSDGWTREESSALAELEGWLGRRFVHLQAARRDEGSRRLAAIGAMSAGLAHEIRNPLAGIHGAAQVLEGEGLSLEGRAMVEVILAESARLQQVVSRVLDLSRPIHVSPRAGDLNAVFEHAVRVVRVGGLPPDARLTFTPTPDLGAVWFDHDPLVAAVLNLIRNAVEAAGPGGHVEIGCERVGSGVVFTIRDDGPGLTEDVRAQLFTPFYTTRPSGTGLGLVIARRILEAHGGRLDADPPAGTGTVFRGYLPTPDPSEGSEEAGAGAHASGPS